MTLITATVLSSPAAVFASDVASEGIATEEVLSDTPVSVPEETPVVPNNTSDQPTPTETTVSPGDILDSEEQDPVPGGDGTIELPEEEPTVTPGETTPAPETPSVTETPEQTVTPGVTATPGVTVTPGATATPGVTATPAAQKVTDAAKSVIEQIDALSKVTITIEHKAQIQSIRTAYNALSIKEKSTVSNYQTLVELEKKISDLEVENLLEDGEGGDLVDGQSTTTANVQIGSPIYFTNMVSNLHAGNEFYLNSLKQNYQLSFSTDFASVMESIETEYKKKNNLEDLSDRTGLGVSSSSDSLLVRNWQDILAVYVYEHQKEANGTYVLDASCKEDLAEIFAEMNPVIRDENDSTRVSYGNHRIDYYIKKHKIAKKDQAVLEKYVETDCKLLCAVVTAAKGFVRESVGDDVSEERVNVITAAYSLVGKVGYFWGGKSVTLGMDSNWGVVARVTEEGSSTTGTLRAYGLDCSGFVTWAVINGYQNQGMYSLVGTGTSEQWDNARVVSEADAQPGDLVFQKGSEAGTDNHVGIICGKTDDGDWIVVHCSAEKNGVTVGEAYSAGFRYIRQPSFYPTQAELDALEQSGVISDTLESVQENVTLSGRMQSAISSSNSLFDSASNNTATSDIVIDSSSIEPF
jgi:hypothetical protein